MRKCENCNAVATASDAAFCSFCGAELPRAARASPPSPYGDLPARFAAAEAHPSFGRARRKRPPTTAVGYQLGGGVIFGLFFAGVAAFIAFSSGSMGSHGFFGLIPVLFVAVGIGMAVVNAGKAVTFQRATLRRKAALVVDQRTKVSGGGQNSSASTTYYVTLQFESGRREEYAVSGRTAGRVTRGDMGVAFLKGAHLLDFDRLPV